MRRLLAISLLLLFGLPVAAPLLGMDTSAAEASLPACCRRLGQHHCVLMQAQSSAPSSGFGMGSLREKCPYAPAAPALLLLRSFSPSPKTRLSVQIAGYRAAAAQIRARGRSSFQRVYGTRGPPSVLA